MDMVKMSEVQPICTKVKVANMIILIVGECVLVRYVFQVIVNRKDM
jgi:hypothetical protein